MAHPANNVHRIDGADPDLDADLGVGSPGSLRSGQLLSPHRPSTSLGRPSPLARRSPTPRGGLSGSLGGSFGGSLGGSPVGRQALFPGKRRAGGASKGGREGGEGGAAAGAAAAAGGGSSKPPPTIELDLVALGMGLRFVELDGGHQARDFYLSRL